MVKDEKGRPGIMPGRVQGAWYGSIATVLLNGKAVHLPDYRRLDRVFLPVGFIVVV